MAHFARIDENRTVVQVIVVRNDCCIDEHGHESEIHGIAFCRSLFGEETNWVQTSYNGNFRTRLAGTGGQYDPERDAFLSPKPFESWVLDEETLEWVAPVPAPGPECEWAWNEENQEWELKICDIPSASAD